MEPIQGPTLEKVAASSQNAITEAQHSSAAIAPKVSHKRIGSPVEHDKTPKNSRSRRTEYRGHGNDVRSKTKQNQKEKGRSQWSRTLGDRRARNTAIQAVTENQKLSGKEKPKPVYAVEFSKEEVANEARRPKRKVAVMIGYSGTGYKGMQLNTNEKTIEGDLFRAFVAAGAISKANADDPKKSALVRCARTDKGVHAAGNVISLKLIIEDADIVERINANLSPQIRVWGIERTLGSFSAYQKVDSRIYEYLIPTHCFLPPHPRSFLGKTLQELSKDSSSLCTDGTQFRDRQKEVTNFWSETQNSFIQPILDAYDPSLSLLVLNTIFDKSADQQVGDTIEPGLDHSSATAEQHAEIDAAVAATKKAILKAKRAHRLPPERLARIRSVAKLFNGTHNFHNYTVKTEYREPCAKRNILSFDLGDKPVIINNSEWLSFKIHGQSFMMHQIRKMVSMIALVVRCGSHPGILQDSFGPTKITLPKAPALGLLLERPVFDVYNKDIKDAVGERNTIDFAKYTTEMQAFRQREIYERIFRDEEEEHTFHTFFSDLDSIRTNELLYLSALGISAKWTLTDAKPVILLLPAPVEGDMRDAGTIATMDEDEDDSHTEDG